MYKKGLEIQKKKQNFTIRLIKFNTIKKYKNITLLKVTLKII